MIITSIFVKVVLWQQRAQKKMEENSPDMQLEMKRLQPPGTLGCALNFQRFALATHAARRVPGTGTMSPPLGHARRGA